MGANNFGNYNAIYMPASRRNSSDQGQQPNLQQNLQTEYIPPRDSYPMGYPPVLRRTSQNPQDQALKKTSISPKDKGKAPVRDHFNNFAPYQTNKILGQTAKIKKANSDFMSNQAQEVRNQIIAEIRAELSHEMPAIIATPLTKEDLKEIKLKYDQQFMLNNKSLSEVEYRTLRNSLHEQKLDCMQKLCKSINDGTKTVTSKNRDILNKLVGTMETFIKERTDFINKRIAAKKDLFDSDKAIETKIRTLKETLKIVKKWPEGIVSEKDIDNIYKGVSLLGRDRSDETIFNKYLEEIKDLTKSIITPERKGISLENLDKLYQLHNTFVLNVENHRLSQVQELFPELEIIKQNLLKLTRERFFDI